jgi:heme/copper-type cytochrome/quinol oxidase subunit 1
MFNFKERPYNLIIFTAFVVLAASFFAFNQTVDIHLHDTYFVITLTHLLWAISTLLLILWTLYILLHRLLFSRFLMWINIVLTIMGVLFLVLIFFYSNRYYEGLAGMPRRYYDYRGSDSVVLQNNLTKAVLISIVVLGLGVLTFIVNLIIGLFNRAHTMGATRF